MKRFLHIAIFFLTTICFAQETIGLITNTDDAYDGLTLFTPEGGNNVYLIDNCGNTINSWTFSEAPGLTCYLLENGSLLRAGRDKLEVRDWDNTLLWEYNINESLGLNQHHDIEPLPNGNILCIVRDIISEQEQIDLGKNPSLINGDLRSEKIIELRPIGSNDAEIVWEWRFIDRIIQDYSPSITETYGDVLAHPERIDFNYDIDGNGNHANWVHANSVEYNANLDQILISCRNLGEIYIIDHSTTTEEAAGHTGGTSNKGGDFLWRWGNPEVYRQGTSSDRELFGQHDAKWIPDTYMNEGNITVFNNGGDGTFTFSSVHILNPTLIANNNYEIVDNKFSPSDFFFTWNGDSFVDPVSQGIKSGVHPQPNGNLLMCESNKGRLREITLSGELAWNYVNPVAQNTVLTQYETVGFGANGIFRGEKYPRNYVGFTGRDLTPGDIIENVNTVSEECNDGLSINEAIHSNKAIAIINPIEQNTIKFSSNIEDHQITIYNTSGQLIFKNTSFTGKELNIQNIESGMYFMEISKNENKQVIKIINN